MVARCLYHCNGRLYDDYYQAQVGHGLPVFVGGHSMRGRGLGSLLGGLIRSAVPRLKVEGKLYYEKVPTQVYNWLEMFCRVRVSNQPPNRELRKQENGCFSKQWDTWCEEEQQQRPLENRLESV